MGAALSRQEGERSLVWRSSRRLQRLLFYAMRFWIYVMGLEKHEELFQRLLTQYRYRAFGVPGTSQTLYKGMALTLLELWTRTLRLVLVPDIFARSLFLTFVFHGVYELTHVARSMVSAALLQLTARGRKMRRLRAQLRTANSFPERLAVASELDKVEGKDKWREDPVSSLYLHNRVIQKTQMYKRLQLENDVIGLMYFLRAGLLRKHWGIGHPRLYSVSHVGTKNVIEEYMDTIVHSMNTVLRASPSAGSSPEEEAELSPENKVAFFSETRHAFGRSALLLSGGGGLGFYHAGVVKALAEHNLLPNVIAGSSAGSIIAGMIGVRTNEEAASCFYEDNVDLHFLSTNITEEDVKEYTPSFMNSAGKPLPKPGFSLLRDTLVLLNRFADKRYVMDSDTLRECLRRNIGDYTFREAYDRTGRIINITVTPLKSDDYPHLLNYLTAPNVLIWSASLASCSIPLVFQPQELLAKDVNGNIVPYYREGLKWSDGSLECDLPMERLSELFNVNHFIASQVNAHYKIVSGYAAYGNEHTGNLLNFLKKQMNAYIRNFAELGLNTRAMKVLDIGLIPLLTQKYEGDITILPTHEVSLAMWLRMLLRDPPPNSFDEIVKMGERATWPHIARIRTMCRIEFALERAVRYLRGEMALADQKKAGTNITRVPSFYTSPSTMNLYHLDHAPKSSSSNGDEYEDMRSQSVGDSGEFEEQHAERQGSIPRTRSMNVAGAVMTME